MKMLLSHRRRSSASARSAFTPASLFAGGKKGLVYDKSDLSTLYQTSDTSTAVTADGDPIGRIEDLSGNDNHATQSTGAARAIYKTSGGLHWAEYDGTDDYYDIVGSAGAFNFLHDGNGGTAIIGVRRTAGTDSTFYSTSLSQTQVGVTLYSTTSDVYRSVVSNGSGTFLILGNTAAVATGDDVITVLHATARSPNYEVLENQVSRFTQNHTGSPSASAAANDLRIGARGDGSPGVFMMGRIYSMILIEGILTGDDLANAEQWTAERAGVTL